MAGLPNSSNALQQWHHLFEAEGTKRSPASTAAFTTIAAYRTADT